MRSHRLSKTVPIPLFFLLAMLGNGCVGESQPRKGTTRISMAPTVTTNAAAASPKGYRFDRRYPPSPDEYDKELESRVNERWRQEIAGRNIKEIGIVKVAFKLSADGQVSDIQVIETSLQGPPVEACKAALLFAGPFERWSQYMRRTYASDHRQIRFTFKYERK